MSHAQRPPTDLIVIGHRGACGYRPEHTLESYRLAIRQGADFIEPDLVPTRDGVLVARHENELSATTDVAAHPGFAHLRTTKRIDGRAVTGWFTEDFTLAELKTLRARERFAQLRPANTRFDGMYAIPTFAEILRLARAHGVGVYPETKYPTYFAVEGRRIDGQPIALSLGALLVRTLLDEGFTDPARVFIQSFEVANLLELAQAILPAAGVAFPLVQLLGKLDGALPYDMAWHQAQGADLRSVYGALPVPLDADAMGTQRCGALATPAALQWMRATYATGLGPWKGSLAALLAPARGAGLAVHPYTVRAEAAFLDATPGRPASALDEAVQLYEQGVQGIFIDQPDLGVAARNLVLHRRGARR